MTASLRAVRPGHHVTLQDVGRRGWRRFGVSGCGAMDLPSLAVANTLVANPPTAAALEFAQLGGAWQVLAESARIAVAGGDFRITADGRRLAPWQSHTLQRGQEVVIETAPDAVWGYLAVAGGFDVAPQLGSCSTHLRSGIGGVSGTRVAAGDDLPLRTDRAPEGRDRRIAPPARAETGLRVVLGPQDDYFAPEMVEQFLAADWRVTHRGDRMGTWLEGPPIAHRDGYNVLSDGLVPGCIQVPGAGQPVVLMMDCQTIGGYPKLATIVAADLPRFAQARAGQTIRFTAIDVEDAQRAYRTHRALLETIGSRVADLPEPRTRPFWLRE
ncbi:MAG: biotin-dependent carboxyltransferase family protein [Acetobacteraceae bacterium]